MKVILSTALALIAFAGNSVLCRLALGEQSIDAASFTAIRLLSGIVVLLVIISATLKQQNHVSKGSWKASFFLFLYAITFSYAYVSLDTGVGALILFGSVQISMMMISYLTGDRFHKTEWLGLIISFSGFIYLVIPNFSSPSLLGFVLMSVSGLAWAAYTLTGRRSNNPLGDTAFNFLRTMPFVILLMAITFQQTELSPRGILLAALSGGIASGIGYTLWYMALSGLTAMRAAILQLLVPVIATTGGVVFAGEALSLRFIIASVTILGGILMVILGRQFISTDKNITKKQG